MMLPLCLLALSLCVSSAPLRLSLRLNRATKQFEWWSSARGLAIAAKLEAICGKVHLRPATKIVMKQFSFFNQ